MTANILFRVLKVNAGEEPAWSRRKEVIRKEGGSRSRPEIGWLRARARCAPADHSYSVRIWPKALATLKVTGTSGAGGTERGRDLRRRRGTEVTGTPGAGGGDGAWLRAPGLRDVSAGNERRHRAYKLGRGNDGYLRMELGDDRRNVGDRLRPGVNHHYRVGGG
jgi:hypothetical protein